MLLKGPRGSGKTVLLAARRDLAEQTGLATVRVTAKPEPTFADALIEQMASVSDTEPRRISSAQVSVLGSGAGVSFQTPEPRELSVHTRVLTAMEHLADKAQRNEPRWLRWRLPSLVARMELWLQAAGRESRRCVTTEGRFARFAIVSLPKSRSERLGNRD